MDSLVSVLVSRLCRGCSPASWEVASGSRCRNRLVLRLRGKRYFKVHIEEWAMSGKPCPAPRTKEGRRRERGRSGRPQETGTLLIKPKSLSRKSTWSTSCIRRDCSKHRSFNILSSGSSQQTEAWRTGVPLALSRSVHTSQEADLMTETRGGTGNSTSSLAILRVQVTKCKAMAEAKAVSLSQGPEDTRSSL